MLRRPNLVAARLTSPARRPRETATGLSRYVSVTPASRNADLGRQSFARMLQFASAAKTYGGVNALPLCPRASGCGWVALGLRFRGSMRCARQHCRPGRRRTSPSHPSQNPVPRTRTNPSEGIYLAGRPRDAIRRRSRGASGRSQPPSRNCGPSADRSTTPWARATVFSELPPVRALVADPFFASGRMFPGAGMSRRRCIHRGGSSAFAWTLHVCKCPDVLNMILRGPDLTVYSVFLLSSTYIHTDFALSFFHSVLRHRGVIPSDLEYTSRI
uniref:Uncharacterized protein n=1 Tax=Mycena chlorophos TaxID=658473 RepID=A0ABQ0LCV4_MYCCL|nr:predicted protein [Mycena chlorophos]